MPRIRHVHLKDIRHDVMVQCNATHLSFMESVMAGLHRPRRRRHRFAPIFAALSEAGYGGWLMVEAEQDAAKANPLDYARKARAYIRATAGSEPMRYRVLEDIGGRRKFVLVLEAGEEVVRSITHFATELKVKGASLTGVGALSRAKLGWFNPRPRSSARTASTSRPRCWRSPATSPRVSTRTITTADRPAASGCTSTSCSAAATPSVRGGHLVSRVSPTMELIIEEVAAR